MKNLLLALCALMPLTACTATNERLDELTEEDYALVVLFVESGTLVIADELDEDELEVALVVINTVLDGTYSDASALVVSKVLEELELDASQNQLRLALLAIEQLILRNGGIELIEVDGTFKLTERTTGVLKAAKRGIEASLAGRAPTDDPVVIGEVELAFENASAI